MFEFSFGDFVWQSDFAGDEVGYPDISVVGFYNLEAEDGYTYTFMIDVENEKILSIDKMDEEE